MQNDPYASMLRSLYGPDVQWRLAERQAANPDIKVGGLSRLGNRASRYLALMNGGPEQRARAAQQYPLIATAVQVWDDRSSRDKLRILAIAGCAVEEMASRLGVAQDVLVAVEHLWFDVRPLLRARDWVAARVIAPQIKAGATNTASQLKLAFCGKAPAARALLDAQALLPQGEAERLYDVELLLHTKLQETLSLPLVSEQGCVQLMCALLEHRTEMQRLKLQQEKFAHKCLQDARQHELRLRQLDAAPPEASDSQCAPDPAEVEGDEPLGSADKAASRAA